MMALSFQNRGMARLVPLLGALVAMGGLGCDLQGLLADLDDDVDFGNFTLIFRDSEECSNCSCTITVAFDHKILTEEDPKILTLSPGTSYYWAALESGTGQIFFTSDNCTFANNPPGATQKSHQTFLTIAEDLDTRLCVWHTSATELKVGSCDEEDQNGDGKLTGCTLILDNEATPSPSMCTTTGNESADRQLCANAHPGAQASYGTCAEGYMGTCQSPAGRTDYMYNMSVARAVQFCESESGAVFTPKN